MLQTFLSELERSGVTAQLAGLVNAESGNIALSARAIKYCESCEGQSFEALQFDCGECGRSPSNYIFSTSGDGDGIYPVWELHTTAGLQGVVCVYDSNYGIANQVRSAIDAGTLPALTSELVDQVAAAAVVQLGGVVVNGSVEVADVFGNSDNASVTITDLNPGSYVAVGFVETPERYSGPVGPRKIDTVRAVALLSPELVDQVSIDDAVNVDWADHLMGAISATVTAHVEPVGDSVKSVNKQVSALRASKPSIPSRQAKFCPQCGFALPSNAKFCAECGSRIPAI